MPRKHRYLPALLMSGAAAVPILTAGEMLAHMGTSASAVPPIPGAGSRTTPTKPTGTASAGHHTSPTPTPSPKAKSQPSKTPIPTPKPAPSPTATQASALNGTFTGGTYPDMFGTLHTSITVQNGKILSVSISAPMDNPTSSYINSQVVPILRSETLKAQSSNINGISGATATSDAYYYSLLDALKKAGM